MERSSTCCQARNREYSRLFPFSLSSIPKWNPSGAYPSHPSSWLPFLLQTLGLGSHQTSGQPKQQPPNSPVTYPSSFPFVSYETAWVISVTHSTNIHRAPATPQAVFQARGQSRVHNQALALRTTPAWHQVRDQCCGEKEGWWGEKECTEAGLLCEVSKGLIPKGTCEHVLKEGEGTNMSGQECFRWRGQQVHPGSTSLAPLRTARRPEQLKPSEHSHGLRGTVRKGRHSDSRELYGARWERPSGRELLPRIPCGNAYFFRILRKKTSWEMGGKYCNSPACLAINIDSNDIKSKARAENADMQRWRWRPTFSRFGPGAHGSEAAPIQWLSLACGCYHILSVCSQSCLLPVLSQSCKQSQY